jgi:hypothetical protein
MSRDPIYAPDGKTWYQTALDEAAKRGEFAARIEQLEASLAEWKALAIQWAKDNDQSSPSPLQAPHNGASIPSSSGTARDILSEIVNTLADPCDASDFNDDESAALRQTIKDALGGLKELADILDVAQAEKVPVARPVAFRVPRVVDDRISKTEFRLFDDEDEARRAACDIGADYDGLYLVADRRAAFFAQPDPSLPSPVRLCPTCGTANSINCSDSFHVDLSHQYRKRVPSALAALTLSSSHHSPSPLQAPHNPGERLRNSDVAAGEGGTPPARQENDDVYPGFRGNNEA